MKLYELFDCVNKFIDQSAEIYLYGSGSFGTFLLEYVRQRREASGFIESKKTVNEKHGIRVYSADEILKTVKNNDGIILSVSEKYQQEIIDNYLSKAICMVLVLEEWKIRELCRFGMYKSNWDLIKDTTISRELLEKREEDVKNMREIKKRELSQLQDRFHFADWHVITDNLYGDDVAKLIGQLIKGIDGAVVIECGCGLCNIIGSEFVGNCKKVGIDREEAVLSADRELYGNKIKFRLGSFEQATESYIDVFVSVNFVNSIPPDIVKDIYSKLFKDRYIKYYVVDEVTGNYRNHYRFKELLPDYYELSYSLGPYAADGGVRYIRVFKRK